MIMSTHINASAQSLHLKITPKLQYIQSVKHSHMIQKFHFSALRVLRIVRTDGPRIYDSR
jgi:hypothetical protein